MGSCSGFSGSNALFSLFLGVAFCRLLFLVFLGVGIQVNFSRIAFEVSILAKGYAESFGDNEGTKSEVCAGEKSEIRPVQNGILSVSSCSMS